VTKIIAVALQKGGVGKTTTAQHLGHALAMRGRKVLMIDLDPQGSLSNRYDQAAIKTTMADVLGVGGENEVLEPLQAAVIPTHQRGLYLAPCNYRLTRSDTHLGEKTGGHHQLDRLLNDQPLPFDFVVLDTPPGKSNMLLAAMAAADELIVPVQLSPMGFEGFALIDETVTEARELQDIRGKVRLAYRFIVPTFYSMGQQVSDSYLETLQELEHPDYAGELLPLSPPVPETTHFEKASAPRPIPTNGSMIERALTIWEMSQEDIVVRAGNAYMELAQGVEAYG
jgi:chromosome partitioning protein